MAVIGPNADDARNLFGDYTYPAHVESLLEMMRSGRNVFAIPAADGLDAAAAAVDAPTVLEAFRHRLDVDVRFARGCGVNDDSRDGFDEAVATAAGADVAIMVMGDKAGLTDDSDERREPRPLLARPARGAGGPRARGGRNRDAGRARPRRR